MLEPLPAALSNTAFTADVLGPEGTVLASFMCGVDAFRFAAMLYEPGAGVLLRRRLDGSVKPFSPALPAASTLAWLAGSDASSPMR